MDVDRIHERLIRNNLRYPIRVLWGIGKRAVARFQCSFAQMGVRLAADCFAVALAYVGAYIVRFDWDIPARHVFYLLYGLPVTCLVYLLSFLVLKTYRSIWRYASVEDLWRIAKASALGGSLHALVVVLLGWRPYPRSILVSTTLLTPLLMGGMRLLARSRLKKQKGVPLNGGARRVLIIGAGRTGESIAREIRGGPTLDYNLIGFVDNDLRMQGATIRSLPVLGTMERLPEIAREHGVKEAIVALPSASGREMRSIVKTCARAGLEVRVLPSISQLMRGDGKTRYLRKINVDELLGREPVSLNEVGIAEFLHGKRVMVTGAGGSVGSELSRQLVSFGVQSLIMVERAENALYNISLEIKEHSSGVAVTAALADIKHIPRMSEIFERTRPQIVFHAAAYKQVPILEDHPGEAVLNNVIGTRRLAEVAQKFGVETFVLISTDKAVRPKNLMGATKKVCEMYVTALNRVLRQSHGPGRSPRFFVVRFGNVLGSEGSVVPLFQKQIENGEPLTITDPRVSRYFMTTSEAVGLVLQTTSMACDEDVFVLNMGDPIKIDELANDLVVASGLAPSEVAKHYIGLRPGDKLHERLWDSEEQVMPSEHEKIFAARQPQRSFVDLEESINALETLAMIGDVPGLLQRIQEIIPDYAPSRKASPFTVPETGEKYHVLIIDDDEALVEMLSEALKATYKVTTAHSASEGFNRIHAEIPHLILLDVKLDDQSGLQMCHTLRAQPGYCHIPIMMMTGYGDEMSVVTVLRAGADDYLPKPFRLEELHARIDALLRRAGRRFDRYSLPSPATESIAST